MFISRSNKILYCAIILLCIHYSHIVFSDQNIIQNHGKIFDKKNNISPLQHNLLSGPKAVKNKKISFVAADLRNGGIRGVAEGVSEAAAKLNWSLQYIDGQGSSIKQSAALSQALHWSTDGIILGGIDAKNHLSLLQTAHKLNIPIVGWHSAEKNGRIPELHLFTNITTDPSEVATLAVQHAVQSSQGKAKIIIFSDSEFNIARTKAKAMIDIIEKCKECELLEVKDISISKTKDIMPKAIETLLATYGNQITHFLAINDLYLDYATPALRAAGVSPTKGPQGIAAGDGSKTSYQRIRTKQYQTGVAAEPLLQHGWQAIDELNRAFTTGKPSNFISSPYLIHQENIGDIENKQGIYDPNNNYRQAYLNSWLGE